MTIEFRLPEVSDGVASADVAEILVSEGDWVEADQIVMELETEKAVVELPCPVSGRVVGLHVRPGDTVPIGGLLMTIAESDEESAAASAEAGGAKILSGDGRSGAAATQGESLGDSSPANNQTVVSGGADVEASSSVDAPVRPSAEIVSGESGGVVGAVSDVAVDLKKTEDATPLRPPAPAGPATRRLARELGVDLHSVHGTGPGGRITQDDVKAFVRQLALGGSSSVGGRSVPPLPDFSQFGPIERQKLNKIGQASAANLSVSWQVIPHVTQHDEADITDLEASRRAFLAGGGRGGPKVTMTAILMKALVPLLKSHPNFNASFDAGSNEVVLKRYYNIGCAVDTPYGLLVPVLRDVDRKTILEIAAELSDLAARARERKLALEEMQGATFTVTNLGGIGGTGFTPIVNYPEVAILGVSRTQPRLELRDGRPVERLKLPLSLSYDHRVINGAAAARFLRQLAAGLSDVFQLVVGM